MRLHLPGAVLILGRVRKDGYRRVYAVRLRDWGRVHRLLRAAKMKCRLDGEKLYVWPRDPNQRVFTFLEVESPRNGATPVQTSL